MEIDNEAVADAIVLYPKVSVAEIRNIMIESKTWDEFHRAMYALDVSRGGSR